jgi:hypothetical protein
MANKKARNGSGTVERRGALWWARISATGKPRKRLPMPGSETWTRAQARRQAAKDAADYAAGRIVFDETPRTKGPIVAGSAMTVRQLGEAWTSGELTKTYGNVNKLRIKAGAKIDEWCLKANAYEVRTRGPSGHVFGDLSVAAVTTDDVSKVMAAQPKEHRSETRVKQYNRLHRLFDLAIFPARIRPDNSNPVVRYLRPSPDADKLFCFLYPSEALALLRGRTSAGEIRSRSPDASCTRSRFTLASARGVSSRSIGRTPTSITARSRASRRRRGPHSTSSATAD